MECEQEVRKDRISRPFFRVAGSFVCLVVAGCTGGVSAPEPESTLDSQAPPAVVSVPLEVAGGMPGWVKYPVDTDADDPPGMIVTGLGELAGSPLVSPWLVSVRTFRRAAGTDDSQAGDATIELARYAEDFPVAEHVRFFSESLDTCLIRNEQGEQGVDQSNLPPPGIGGGESVTFNTPSGPWFSINQRRLADAQRVYQADDLLPGALPVDTTLAIPGDAFPTVGAYPLFEAEPVIRLLPDASQPVTTESRYSWLPLDQPGHVKIDFMAYDQEDDFQGFPASCWVKDDGSFDLPGEVLEAMEPFEVQAGRRLRLAVRYSRVYSRVDLVDGIVFHHETEVAE